MTAATFATVTAELDDIYKFGDALIDSGDLDPVYCALYGAQLPEPQLGRLLLSYLAFYSLGLAARLSEHEGESYWHAMLVAAKNDTPSPLGGRWPRGGERRHFRGAKCINAVKWLRNKYSMPEAPVRSLLNCKTEKQVIERVCQWPMFGNWAGFKAAAVMPTDSDITTTVVRHDPLKIEVLRGVTATDITTTVVPTDTDITTTDVPVEIIDYDDAVAQGKAIVARLDADWWALCELAARLAPKQTRKRFFADIGIGCVGERRLNVYGAWRDVFAGWAADGTSAPGPSSVPFTVLRELQSHPARGELLKSKPTMKKEDAVQIMRAYRKKTRVRSWRRDEITKQLDQIQDAAKCAKRLELKLVREPADYRLLLEIVMPRRTQLVADLRAGSAALRQSAELLDQLEQHITEADHERGATEDVAAANLQPYHAAAAEALAARVEEEGEVHADAPAQ
jgi:hypothetical protein